MLESLRSDAATLHEWLLDRLDNDPGLADCQLRSQARAVSLTTAAGEEETAKVRSLARAGSELTDLFARIVLDCMCAAVNPPCAPCEDADVLLACLEVADCTVVRICNAERDYVLSGSALRYWLPTSLLRQGIECLCCGGEPGRDVARAESRGLAFAEAGFSTGEQVAAWPRTLLGVPDPIHLLRKVMEQSAAAPAARRRPAKRRTTQPPSRSSRLSSASPSSLSNWSSPRPASARWSANRRRGRRASRPRARRVRRVAVQRPDARRTQGPADAQGSSDTDAQPDTGAGTAGSDAPEGSDDS